MSCVDQLKVLKRFNYKSLLLLELYIAEEDTVYEGIKVEGGYCYYDGITTHNVRFYRFAPDVPYVYVRLIDLLKDGYRAEEALLFVRNYNTYISEEDYNSDNIIQDTDKLCVKIANNLQNYVYIHKNTVSLPSLTLDLSKGPVKHEYVELGNTNIVFDLSTYRYSGYFDNILKYFNFTLDVDGTYISFDDTSGVRHNLLFEYDFQLLEALSLQYDALRVLLEDVKVNYTMQKLVGGRVTKFSKNAVIYDCKHFNYKDRGKHSITYLCTPAGVIGLHNKLNDYVLTTVYDMQNTECLRLRAGKMGNSILVNILSIRTITFYEYRWCGDHSEIDVTATVHLNNGLFYKIRLPLLLFLGTSELTKDLAGLYKTADYFITLQDSVLKSLRCDINIDDLFGDLLPFVLEDLTSSVENIEESII